MEYGKRGKVKKKELLCVVSLKSFIAERDEIPFQVVLDKCNIPKNKDIAVTYSFSFREFDNSVVRLFRQMVKQILCV